MGFALSHSTMRAQGTREDPSAGHIRCLAITDLSIKSHEDGRGRRLWTGDEPPSLQADWFSSSGGYTFSALAAFRGS
jgi:hypothetical protein